MITLEKARDDHVYAVLGNMREFDKPNFALLSDPAKALIEAIHKSQSYTVLLDGEAVAIWGADVQSILVDTVFMWMVTTQTVEEHPVVLTRYAAKIIRDILDAYGAIEGNIAQHNKVAVQWVVWLGADLEETADPNVLKFRLRRRARWNQ